MNFRSRFKYISRKVIRSKPDSEVLKAMHSGLLEESTLDIYYVALTIGSCAIATFGLLSNSVAVIIGAMIVAPLMLPIRGLAFASLAGKKLLFRKSAIAIAVGTLISVALACLLGIVVQLPEFGSEVTSRSQPTLIDLGIAIVAGSISGLAKVETKISSSLAGTAIAVALMPPLCVIGLGLSHSDWSLSMGATLLYATNLLGITLSCMLVFLVTGYASINSGAKALKRTVIFTTLLVVPLGISFIRLLQQQGLEALIEDILLNRTTTFQQHKLVSTRFDWNSQTPIAYLRITTTGDLKPTPKQVGLVEDLVEDEIGQRFSLVLEVNQVEQIRSNSKVQRTKEKNYPRSIMVSSQRSVSKVES